MASIRYKRRKTKRGWVWGYEIRQGDKTVASKSGYDTKKAAEIDGLPLVRDFKTGLTLDNKTDLPTLYEQWYDLKVVNSGRSEETLRKYRYFGRLIDENFTDIPVSSIKPSEYQRKINELGVIEKISYNTLIRVNSVIRQTLEMIIADGFFVKDFTKNVVIQSSYKEQQPEEKYIHSLEEYNQIIDYLKENMDFRKTSLLHIIYFLFRTGFRYGELIGLTSKELDLENGFIFTRRRYNANINKFVPSKTEASIRRIPISQTDTDILKKMLQQQKQICEALNFDNEFDMVFFHPMFEYGVPHSTETNYAIKKMLKTLKIEPIISSKGARHTVGSVLLAQGFSLDYVANFLGHKDISMITRVYGHSIDENMSYQTNKLKELFD